MLTWQDVIEDKSLQDLPYKIELSAHGKVEMRPASNMHGGLQAAVTEIFVRHLSGGRAITGCSVQTRDGVRVPDVAWCSDAFLARHGFATPFVQAPEICVEVVSASNSAAEMTWKTALYFQSGADEVWLVDLDGTIRFFGPEGVRTMSRFAPVPTAIDLPYSKRQ